MLDVGDDAGAALLGEFGGSFDFGKHGASFEITVFFELGDFGGGNCGEGLLIWQAVVEINVWHGSDRNKNIGFDFFGKFFSGVVFVDNGVYAFETLEDFSTSDGDAATASSNNNDAVFD